jgi:acetoin utilization protein AcuB
MKVDRCMKRPVLNVKPRDSIAHARALMEEHRVNQLPVVVEDRLIGIITDRDLRDAFPSVFEASGPRRGRGADPAAITVEEVMTADPLSLEPNADVREGARLMRGERIGALPIVSGGRLVGILTRSDVLDAFLALGKGSA